MAVLMAFQAAFPLGAYALTSGPTQPEFNEFEPIGTTQMVDLFSGDFTYNIPLLELPGPDGGYPFNLAYHSGITMDQEASWVGLGWSLNNGAITRTMRGLPDDFAGDEIERRMHMRPNQTWEFGIKGSIEIIGVEAAKEKGELDVNGKPLEQGVPAQPGKLGLALGFKVMHNNYKGWGLGLDFGLNTKFIKNELLGFNGGVNLGVNSFDGANLQPNLSFGKAKDKLKWSFNASFNIGGREGMKSLSLTHTETVTVPKKTRSQEEGAKQEEYSVTKTPITARYSFVRSSYSPQVSTPYRGLNFSGNVKGGTVPFFGIGVGPEINVSFTRQRLKDNGRWISAKAFGYFHHKSRMAKEDFLLDFNREKDGPINESTPNLGNPITTPDIYSVKGQGIGGVYRPYRSDIGILTDAHQVSNSGGGEVGLQVNPGNGFDLGVDLGVNYAFSATNRWTGNVGAYEYSAGTTPDYESWYFKAAGEQTAEASDTYAPIGGDQANRLRLNGRNVTGELEFDDGSLINSTMAGPRAKRKPRGMSILPITNGQIAALGKEALETFRINYYGLGDLNNYDGQPEEMITRDIINKKDHVAGISAVQSNGARYIYALPVKNIVQEEIVFSIPGKDRMICDPITDFPTNSNNGEPDFQVSNSDEFLDHNVIPEYTHAHLLTAVLGADYIDLDDIPGPSDGDYGYWVKFNYIKTSDNYQWKTPFHGANYLKGRMTDESDDKASIMYGQREQYYLATAETRTHIVEFDISFRRDGRGVLDKYQKFTGTPSTGMDTGPLGSSYKLDKINLYSKLERFDLNGDLNSNAEAIKTIHLNYKDGNGDSYVLCKNVRNNDGLGTGNLGGKLTLGKVHFTYRNSDRGALSPYKFEYSSSNPDYSDQHYDRWGTYRGVDPNDECDILNHPYTYQDAPPDASAWHLEKIHLPSGASIVVDYESDDYAYVQNQAAMQMFEVKGVGANVDGIFNTSSSLSAADRRIYFTPENQTNPVEDYLRNLHGVKTNPDESLNYEDSQVYYKMQVDLNGKDSYEYISGYAKIENAGEDANGYWIELAPANIGTKNNKRDYHPVCAAAWQLLKVEYPGLLSTNTLNGKDESNFKDALGEFASAFGSIGAIFKKYYRHCSAQQLAREIDLTQSYIRLNSPDKIKYGGGSRVKQITIDDNWDIGEDGNLDTPTYGQYFDYTIEEDGDVISSGVAANEPAAGYEECALRYAKQWTSESLFQSDENLIYEYPLNESYYPGASVGYSKVTVKSLATHYVADLKGGANYPGNLPDGFATTGITVNSFYTAKDFPVLTEETGLEKSVSPKLPNLGLFGYPFSEDKYAGSQGYAITLNDMHGKPHKVTHYGLDKNDDLMEQKLSETIYTYSTNEKEIDRASGNRKLARTLDNEVEVLLSDNGNAVIEPQLLGVDYEYFMDMRETNGLSARAHAELGVDFSGPLPPLFAFTVWPNASLAITQTRTAVTNKIIRKSGILKQIDVYDGQSHIRTTNEIFDPLTGQPLLTTVNNHFDDLVYNYSIPARMPYDRMGAAYQNIGMTFEGILQMNTACAYFELSGLDASKAALLVPGDECIITGTDYNGALCTDYPAFCENPKFIYAGQKQGAYVFENDELETGDIPPPLRANMLVTRSGRRNHLNATAASITALKDPIRNRTTDGQAEQATIQVPTSASSQSPYNVDITHQRVDEVLSASAIVYSDEWDLERGECEPITVTIPNYGSGGGTSCECLYIGYSFMEPAGGNCDLTVEWQVQGGPLQTLVLQDGSTCGTGAPLDLANFDNCALIACSDTPIDPTSINVSSGCDHADLSVIVPSSNSQCGGSGGTPAEITITLADFNFEIGHEGIWRPLRDYTYVADRKADDKSATTTVDLRKDGIVNGMPLFNWKNPFFVQTPAGSAWKHSSETTKYGVNGEAVESRDVLGLYSSALYGYKDNLPIAVAANARHYEVAYDGFEEYETGYWGSGLDENGNLDFECPISGTEGTSLIASKTATETYNILGGIKDGKFVIVDKPYYDGIPNPTGLTLILKEEDGTEVVRQATVKVITSLDPTTTGLNIPFRQDVCVVEIDEYLPDCEDWTADIKTGRVIFDYCYDVTATTNCSVEISDQLSHSGTKSLWVYANTTFNQSSLRLEKARQYVLSAWVHRADIDSYTYDNDHTNITIDGLAFKPTGPIIEGWQRIEGIFSYSGNSLTLDFNVAANNGGGHQAYFDDLRIYPLDGGMQSYVYDPVDYRLKAVLDDNNYATFYEYDEEGNLYLQKKETAKGIKTIQETRQYVLENQ